jgi:hypothetical protein
MRALRAIASTLALVAAFWSAPAAAYEYSAWVPVSYLFVFTSGTYRTYYIYANGSWGFANCPASLNASYMLYAGTDPSAKDWYAMLLAAKMAGSLVQVVITDCTTQTVAQVGMK